jgi:EKC/KEOPS complex subunit CGI121/TPRKB
MALQNGKVEEVLLPHLPETHTIHMALYANVTNADFLHKQLLQGNTDFEYAFLDAQVLLSRTHILSACWRAINDQRAGRLKTRNVHSEIVFALSANNNVRISSSYLVMKAITNARISISTSRPCISTAHIY